MILERNTDFFGFKKIALFFVGQMEERPHSCFPLAANVDAQCNVDPSIQLPIWFSHTNLLLTIAGHHPVDPGDLLQPRGERGGERCKRDSRGFPVQLPAASSKLRKITCFLFQINQHKFSGTMASNEVSNSFSHLPP